VIRQAPEGSSQGHPGIFFAARTREMPGAQRGHRYWRYVEFDPAEASDGLVFSDLQMLRRIDPEGAEVAELEGTELEGAWQRAAADILETHNARADPRAAQASLGPAQQWALELLRDPSVTVPEGADVAAEALSVERSTIVRRALNAVRAELAEDRIDRVEAARLIVQVVRELGLRPIEPEPLPEIITEEDLGVVCWMVVLPANP
jgi:hypothetical protein